MDLKIHLNEEENCRTLYCRKLRVKEVNAVMVICFQCIFCNQQVRQLAPHLKNVPVCLHGFVDLFDIDEDQDIEAKVKFVMTKVKNLKPMRRFESA